VSNVEATKPAATTIDALFGPLENVITEGRVWVYENGQLEPVRVRLGVSDGQTTELVFGSLEPGMELVTSISTGDEAQRSTAAAATPFAPGFPGGGGPGGRMIRP
jgi:multidrug efflux pump subunit AcrA (membrane-fusion protein)